MFKFYVALYIAKLAEFTLKLLRRNASYFPGKIAVTICPDFLGKIDKPKRIIAVTGTNGKTTVCNLIIDSLEKSGIKVLNNKLGANINAGVATSLINGVNMGNKTKFETAVLEVDERSSLKIYPYIKPNYIVCTNLFRDSVKRNAHPEYISEIINKAIPKDTTLILNADDLISSSLGKDNKKVFFAIDKLDSDLTESINIINDVRICPKCHTELKYNYVRYHHIGNAYCPNCDFKSPEADYLVKEINYDKNYMIVKNKEKEIKYSLISDSIFNLYNEICAITLLSEIGIEQDEIQKQIENIKIVESRYQKENINGINMVTNLAKGQNPVACSCVFNYVKKELGKKEIILIVDDFFDNNGSSENLTWIYDCDFEFLNDESIERIIIGGKRSQDYYLRLLLAGVPKEKIFYSKDESKTPDYLSLEKDKTIYILFDMYNQAIVDNVKKIIKNKILGKEN